MRYRVVHRSVCAYAAPVEGALHAAFARPRSFESSWRTQRCLRHGLRVEPEPDALHEEPDAWGNHRTLFEVPRPHRELRVTADSLVDVCSPPPPDAATLAASLPWEAVAASAAAGRSPAGQAVLEQAIPTARTPPSAALRAYARESFTPGRPVAAAAVELSRRVFADFDYDPAATDLSTPVAEVFERRAGVCQDFAHLALAMLRGLGLPARYVSGYVRTGSGAAEGDAEEGLIGSDASHAWLAVHLGSDGGEDLGWLDVDPTNAKVAGEEHLTLAWGRDYADVSPLKGVLVGGGRHDVRVQVAVRPVAEGGSPASLRDRPAPRGGEAPEGRAGRPAAPA